MAFTGYQLQQRHRAKKKEIQDKANAIVREKIRRITKRDTILYKGLFAYPVLKEFAVLEGKKMSTLMLIILMDVHPVMTIKEAILWGYKDYEFYAKTTILSNEGYIVSQKNFAKVTKHFLTLKGKLIVQEFNKFYDERVREIFKHDGIRDKEAIRKVIRVQSPRIYKPRNKPASGKPSADS